MPSPMPVVSKKVDCNQLKIEDIKEEDEILPIQEPIHKVESQRRLPVTLKLDS